MEYNVILNEEQVGLLKSILIQIESTPLIKTPSIKPKKLSKMEQCILSRNEYRARKEALKNR